MLSKEECISNWKDELIAEYPFLSNKEAKGFMHVNSKKEKISICKKLYIYDKIIV